MRRRTLFVVLLLLLVAAAAGGSLLSLYPSSITCDTQTTAPKVTGYVTDKTTGMPIQGALVVFDSEIATDPAILDDWGKTDVNGCYAVIINHFGPREELFNVTVSAAGYTNITEAHLVIEGAGSWSFALTPSPGAPATPPPSSTGSKLTQSLTEVGGFDISLLTIIIVALVAVVVAVIVRRVMRR